jgi:hypothetical protein
MNIRFWHKADVQNSLDCANSVPEKEIGKLDEKEEIVETEEEALE